MNLLYTSTSYPPAIGGAQLYFHALAKAFAERNDVRVVTHWDTNRVDWLLGTTLRAPSVKDDYRIDNVPVHRIAFSFYQRVRSVPGLFSYPICQRRATQWLAAALIQKLEVAAPCADLVHNNRIGREPLTLASLNFAHEHQIPFVFTPYHHPRWTGWRYRVYLDLYRQADALIALTEAEKNTYIDLGVDETRIHVVGAPGYLSSQVDGNTFRQMYNLGDNPIVLFVGQKYPYKGIDLMLEATTSVWKTHPSAVFVFVGPRTKYSKELFSRYEDSRILEVGPVSLQEKSDAFAACDLFCMPSGQESFGQVFVEAWSLMKPVIAADIPAERALITDSVNGFLVTRSAEDVAEKIIRMLNSEELRCRMGKQGYREVQDKYTMERIVEKTGAVYRAVLSK